MQEPPKMYRRQGRLAAIERLLLLIGFLLLALYTAARIHSMITSRAALKSLQDGQRARMLGVAASANPTLPADSSLSSFAADKSLWSKERIRAYRRNAVRPAGTPLAVLRIPKLQLEVPVLEGTDRLTLNSGVGRIAGTAFPGEPGNIGITGHRDGFFRGLKDIGTGDTIQLDTGQRTDTYTVDKIEITLPDDISVLRSHARAELTLVTCYPFYFVGPAPKRYVVRASLTRQTVAAPAVHP